MLQLGRGAKSSAVALTSGIVFLLIYVFVTEWCAIFVA